jgi:hypothetical protein
MMANMDSIILPENQAVALGRVFGEGQPLACAEIRIRASGEAEHSTNAELMR